MIEHRRDVTLDSVKTRRVDEEKVDSVSNEEGEEIRSEVEEEGEVREGEEEKEEGE